MAELEKLNTRLDRARKALEKKLAAAQKYGVSEWTDADRFEWMATIETRDGFIVNKADIEKNGAWFDLLLAKDNVEDIEGKIARAEIRMAKAEEEIEKYRKEIEETLSLQEKEKLFQMEFEQEQAEWLKDGINLKGRYYGTTPAGKKFWIERNHGWTERSLHCYTLSLTDDNGNAYTVFTSGEFWRAYAIIKKS